MATNPVILVRHVEPKQIVFHNSLLAAELISTITAMELESL